jgi:alcohol dehydrogenase class IV
MPKLSKDEVPEIKLDAGAAFIESALTDEQRRGLFERPGTCVIAIVELTSKAYTGFAEGEEKTPQVKLRVTLAEAGRDDEQTRSLLDVMRAMMRRRRMDQTLDELGPGTRDAEQVVANVLADYPTESEYEQHRREHAH